MRQLMLFAVLVAGCAPYTPGVLPVPVTPKVVPVTPDIPDDGQRHWVVTDKLEEVEPNPIDQPPDPIPDNPPTPFVPQVETVCTCGCGKTGCGCGRMNSAAQECPGDTSPVLQLNDAALAGVGALERPDREIVDVYVPTRCGNCPAWMASLGQGHGRIVFRYLKMEPPAFVNAVTGGTVPAFVYDGQVLFPNPTGQNAASIATIVESRMTTRTSGQEMRAVNIGAMRGRQAVGKFLDAIQGSATAPVMVFGSSSITLPPQCRFTVTASSQGTAVTFADPRPTVRYGSGFLSVARSLTSLTIGRDTVTLGIAGFPDVALTLQN